jgi:polysaccharide deacetylase family protein (PEP-CTERM system associated)
MLNAFTVDVEDYFHVSAFSGCIRRSDWESFPSRVAANTHRTLELLDEYGVRATFFILGWVAQRHPRLVREIHAAGHEIGNHSYWHRLIYEQTPDQFRSDLLLANRVLEDIIGEPVVAFRAPSFSITQKSLWALEILAEEGFRFDSSVFPVRHHRYGIPGARRLPHTLTFAGGELHEFPPSVFALGKFHLPVGGGGYFRLYPGWLTRHCLHRINASNQPVMFYIHPWELDLHQPRVEAAKSSRFRHYVNLSRTEPRLRRLLQALQFAPMRDAFRAFLGSTNGQQASVPLAAATSGLTQ